MGATWGIVLAAGEGRRFGGEKQFASLAGRAVFEWSLATALATLDAVVLVLPPTAPLPPLPPGVRLARGGATRPESVRSGLALVPEEADVVVVHDAARPLAGAALFHAVVEAVQAGADGAVPGLPVSDTVKRIEDGFVTATLDREGLVTVQTPQAFRAGALRAAHASSAFATDDAALLEAAGFKVRVVPGEAANLKLTEPGDLHLAGQLLVASGRGR